MHVSPHALLALGLLGALGAASCGHATLPVMPEARRAQTTPAPVATKSNVLRGDYVGSAACAACHAKESRAWARSPMHRMTRLGDAADVSAPFDGRAMQFHGDVVTLESHDGKRFIRIAHAGSSTEVYGVTRVIGGRTREDFAGVRVLDGSGASEGEETVLPVSYLIFAGTLRYKGYSVLVHERSSAQAGPVWGETCIFCHNTVPFLSTVLGALGSKARSPGYQGEQVDPLLPAEAQWRWSVSDPPALGHALADEIAHLGAPRPSDEAGIPALVRDAIVTTRARFRGDDLVEVGIGCESCHGGARAHLDDPATTPSFLPYAPFLSLRKPPSKSDDAARAQAINHVCARCHQVLFSRYPWTWEGGHRQSADRGGSPINSGEGRDFLLGGCASALACTACHDPHDAEGRRAKEDALATPAGNPVCTRCHTELAAEASLRAHAHHDPRGAGGACVACHMPRKNMGLDLRLTRYHRIGSPTDPARVELDRPLECALCHTDKSIESLVSTMERWWNKAYSRDLLTRLYGDLSARTLVATLERGKPHERAVAAAVLGAEHDRREAPLIARELVSEYPLVRGFAARALTDALGKDCAIGVGTEDSAHIETEARACMSAAHLPAPSFPALPANAGEPGAEVPED